MGDLCLKDLGIEAGDSEPVEIENQGIEFPNLEVE